MAGKLLVSGFRSQAEETAARSSRWLAIAVLVGLWLPDAARAQPAPPGCKNLNTPREFPEIQSREEWQERARQIREQVLVSCGLWPMPEKLPLRPRIFDKIEREGYSVEKVCFQAFPGFYLAGNLYRPLGRGQGPFAGILNPHGHWREGRLTDTPEGSVPARCINFARQGMVAFAYDMVGFNDTHFQGATTNRPFYDVHTGFATNRADLLWNISLMGLQTWNSIRALDFLESLPDVDRSRLACTGASGGGTQTFMLGAVDERLAAQAPVVMVSHIMQGGCRCENAPGLRVEYSNMEIAAAAAPRPQLLVAATGDWTRTTLTLEGPALARVYRLLGVPENLRYLRFEFGHNYNQTSREAVYAWFGHWLRHEPNAWSLKETAYQKEPDTALRVFPDGTLPEDALTQEQFIASLKRLYEKRWESLAPKDATGLAHYQQTMLPAWRHTLQVAWPGAPAQVTATDVRTNDRLVTADLSIQRPGENSSVGARYWAPAGIVAKPSPKLVVICDPKKTASQGEKASPMIDRLMAQGLAVLVLENFSSGPTPDPFSNYFTTYNRTELQSHVRDLLTVCAVASSADPRQKIAFHTLLCGMGRGGLWCLLAAPGADAVAADCDAFDLSSDDGLLDPATFSPGIRSIGAFQGVAMLAAPHPLLVHNKGARFPTEVLRAAYRGSGAANSLRVEPSRVSEDDLVEWLARN